MAGLPSLADGVYSTLLAPPPTTVVPSNASASGMIGTASMGTPGVPILVSVVNDVTAGVGPITQAAHDLATYARQYIYACGDMGQPAYLYMIRATDGTDTAATMTIQDAQSSPGNVAIFTGFSSGSALNGGTAALSLMSNYPTGQNTYNLTLTTPFGASETFTNLVGWKIVSNSPVYDGPTLIASIKAAVNFGQSSGRGRSAYWIASTPGTMSTFAPALTTFTATGGTDGASGVTTTNLIGVQNLGPSTGIFALSGVQVAQMCIAGFSDLTVASTTQNFAQTKDSGSLFFGPDFPMGTSTTVALTSKNTNGFKSAYAVSLIDWYQWVDESTGLLRWLSPSAASMGIAASLAPSESPSNKPVGGLSFIRQTERSAQPRSETEANLLTQAGVTWIGLTPGGAQFGLVNGQNSGSIAGEDGINWTRNTNAIVAQLKTKLGVTNGMDLTQQANDPTRSLSKKICNDLLSVSNLDAYQTTCDLTNNSQPTIAAGYNFVKVLMTYKAVVRFVMLLVQGGTTVVIPNSNS